MSIIVDEVGQPGWWLKRLDNKLRERRKTIDPLYSRYEGDAPTPRSLVNAPDSARAFFKTARTNFHEMIVKAVRYRMEVSAIITPDADRELGDEQAWSLWRSAGMLAEQYDIYRHMGICGDGFAITAKYKGQTAATAEDPRQVITIHDPVRQSIQRAAAKFFHDEDFKMSYAYLFLPDDNRETSRRYVASKATSNRNMRFSSGWDWDPDFGGAEGESVPIAQPVVRYRTEEGVGEFERHLDILDRIDHMILQGMAIATFQAFKQRGIKADWSEVEDEGEDEDGQVVDLDNILTADPGAIWKLPQSAEMWESGSVDLGPITNMATKEIERLSAVTFTPLWMFAQEGQNQSAAGVHLVREGMTSKIQDRMARAGYSHAQLMANLYRINESGLLEPEDLEIIWRPAERYGLSEKYAAGVAAVTAGVPWRTRMSEILQFTPRQVRQMDSERLEDAFASAMLGVSAPTPPEPATTPTEALNG